MAIFRSFLVGIFAVSVCVAQSVNISGIVTDTGGVPLPGAIVRLEKGGQAANTAADGSFLLTGNAGIITEKIGRSSPYKLKVTIHNGLLCINVAEKSAVEIITFDLTGKALSTTTKTMDAGIHSIALPHRGAGVYLYKVKSGSNEFVIKSPLIDGVLQGTSVSGQASSYDAMAKQAKVAAAINDVITVIKDGYLNYRVIVTNPDTSGIEIKMIVCAGTVTDADGNVYQAVAIGTQVWMVENLKTTKYNDGTTIPLVTNGVDWAALSSPGYCWYNNDAANNKSIFGALYNWSAVNTGKLAPIGWHVPTDAEWTVLTTFLGGERVAGKKLKEAGTAHWPSLNTGVTNETGFTALPGGCRYYNGAFYYIGSGYWWSATAYDATYAWYRTMYCNTASVHHYGDYNQYGFSVRCIKDWVRLE